MNNAGLIQTYNQFCEWAPTSFLLISDNVFDPLIYYSHLLPVLLALPLAIVIFFQAPRQTLNRWLLVLVTLFSLWSLFDLVLWAHADATMIMFFWSLLILIEPLIYLAALFFAYYAMYKKAPSTMVASVFGVLALPIIILLPTSLAIESFNLTNCYREVTEGPLVFYGYLFQILVFFYIFLQWIWYRFSTKDTEKNRRSSTYAVMGIILFLLVFSSGNIAGSLFENWTVGQYATFGMPILVAFLGYVITHYRMFKSKVISTELLVTALGVLTLSLLLLQSMTLVRVVSALSFVLIVVLGALLIRSVRREVKQRQEIENLADRLKKANKRLKELDQIKSEFVSIASHQLRSPLTSIRGYTSMLLEGSYGKIPKKATDALERISDSGRFMALTVEDFLNVSRIESGSMKYEYSDLNAKKLTEKVVDDMRQAAIQKGLVITFRSDCDSTCMVHADNGKLRQVLHNLIDNAMKYTPKGSIKVLAYDQPKKKKMYIAISDTGVGMDKKTMEAVFEKFVRSKNANKVNVSGAGLGLYVAKQMIEKMGGSIIPESEGEGKGSTFTIELPLVE